MRSSDKSDKNGSPENDKAVSVQLYLFCFTVHSIAVLHLSYDR